MLSHTQTQTHLQVAVDVAEHVHRRLDEEAARFVLEDGSRSRAQPQHVSRELDRREVGGVLLRGLCFVCYCFVSFGFHHHFIFSAVGHTMKHTRTAVCQVCPVHGGVYG